MGQVWDGRIHEALESLAMSVMIDRQMLLVGAKFARVKRGS